MNKLTRPRGTQDVLPADSYKWQYIEELMRRTAHAFGYGELRLPTFEATEVFTRSVGDTTDIVQKEMYTFEDKGGRSVTLRPEGTAGVARAVLENGMLAACPLPLKAYYIQSCFRYEKAQKGRLREFHQFGVECYGAHDAACDAEVIELGHQLFCALGIREAITLEINSIGCPACRPAYLQKLREYFEGYRAELCPTCLERLEKNPMRILDCKEQRCSEIAAGAPLSLDNLCPECEEHFTGTRRLLDEAEVPYVVNPRIVRGLDYYTNTVFEFIAEGVGTQGTVCAGGRYDGLIAEMGGKPTPGIGFAAGIERILLLLEEQGRLPAPPHGPLVYAVGMGEQGRAVAARLVRGMRSRGMVAETDVAARSIKAQMKAANRLGAVATVVVGDNEVSNCAAKVKLMSDGSEREMSLEGDLVQNFIAALAGEQLDGTEAASIGVIGGSDGPTTHFTSREEA